MTITIFVPGPLTTKNVRGLGLWKHRRLVRDARERAAHAMLITCHTLPGQRWPWSADLPKHVQFTARLGRLLDDDSLPYAIAPYRDALGDCQIIGKTPGTWRGPGRVKDAPGDGHRFTYTQVVAHDRRGVDITVSPLGEAS